MNENKSRGLVTELQCQTYLTQLGYTVLTPLSEDCRYDMVVDIEGYLIRVQIKTAKEKTTGISFSIRSVRMNHTNGNITQIYNKEQIDYFGTYYENKMYLVPVELCGSAERTLSFEKTPYNNNGILLLSDFIAEKQIELIKNGNNNFSNIDILQNERKVYQYDLKGNFLNAYLNFAEAARAINKPDGRGHIQQAITGKRKTAYGYIWKYKE